MKAQAIFYLLELEKQGQVTRGDGYQDILNAIASDVRSKHRRRIQRQQEKASMREALQHLRERRKQFEEQIKSYHDYVDQAMATMQKSKGYCHYSLTMWKFVNPWIVQSVVLSFHLRSSISIFGTSRNWASHLNSDLTSIAPKTSMRKEFFFLSINSRPDNSTGSVLSSNLTKSGSLPLKYLMHLMARAVVHWAAQL